MSDLFRVYEKPYGGGYLASRIWKKIRFVISMIYNHRCAVCEDTHRLTVHHINLLKNDCRLSNLVLLCQLCHIKSETHHDSYLDSYFTIQENIEWGDYSVSLCECDGSDFKSSKKIRDITEEEAKEIEKVSTFFSDMVSTKIEGKYREYKENKFENTKIPNVWIHRVRFGNITYNMTEEDFYKRVKEILV